MFKNFKKKRLFIYKKSNIISDKVENIGLAGYNIKTIL